MRAKVGNSVARTDFIYDTGTLLYFIHFFSQDKLPFVGYTVNTAKDVSCGRFFFLVLVSYKV